MKKIVVISDTHNHHDKITIPECDILIHCGDATMYGTAQEAGHFLYWFERQKADMKIFVPGNHDQYFEDNKVEGDFICLIDESISYKSISIFGSPWRSRPERVISNARVGFDAFSVLHKDIQEKRKKIPSVNILITHYPPKGILDRAEGVYGGCEYLLARTNNLNINLHVFGHVHSGYGSFYMEDRIFINAAMCDENNELTKEPVIIYYDEKRNK